MISDLFGQKSEWVAGNLAKRGLDKSFQQGAETRFGDAQMQPLAENLAEKNDEEKNDVKKNGIKHLVR